MTWRKNANPFYTQRLPEPRHKSVKMSRAKRKDLLGTGESLYLFLTDSSASSEAKGTKLNFLGFLGLSYSSDSIYWAAVTFAMPFKLGRLSLALRGKELLSWFRSDIGYSKAFVDVSKFWRSFVLAY